MASSASWLRSLPSLARRHVGLVFVLLLAAVLRVAVEVTYPSAFYFPDSRVYVLNSLTWEPHYMRPSGYALFLKPFVPGSFGAVALAQHLLGLGLVAAGYAFAVRRGVSRWLATVAVLPIALDARQLAVEHYVTAETLFIVLAGAALMVLAWPERLGTINAVAGGLLLGVAAATRSVGLPLGALVFGYLLVRRVGWRPLAGFTLSLGLLLGGYMVWYHHHHGVYAFNQYQGRFLHARVQSIADCAKLELTDKQRTLCLDTPVAKRPIRPDIYIWVDSPARRLYPGVTDDPFLNEFAWTVIRQQTGDYALLVARETSWHFMSDPPVDVWGRCVNRRWVLPKTPNAPCQAILYRVSSVKGQPTAGPVAATGLSRALSGYSESAMTPGPLLGLGILLALVAALWRPRGGNWRVAADALLFCGGGLALTVISVATSMYEMRYLLPALFLVPIGAVLAVHRLCTTHPHGASTGSPARVELRDEESRSAAGRTSSAAGTADGSR